MSERYFSAIRVGLRFFRRSFARSRSTSDFKLGVNFFFELREDGFSEVVFFDAIRRLEDGDGSLTLGVGDAAVGHRFVQNGPCAVGRALQATHGLVIDRASLGVEFPSQGFVGHRCRELRDRDAESLGGCG